jgi:hypothetical protein
MTSEYTTTYNACVVEGESVFKIEKKSFKFSKGSLLFVVDWLQATFTNFSGSLESPLAASPAQSYHPSSTYFHQQCQWFFDPPPSKQLILKISTAQKMGQSSETLWLGGRVTRFGCEKIAQSAAQRFFTTLFHNFLLERSRPKFGLLL